MVQEVCNALFDALFHILPLGSDLDRIEATPVRGEKEVIPWNVAARTALDGILESFPPLIRISVAKRLRDGAERVAVEEGLDEVGTGEVERARSSLLTGAPA